jgi:hypothetical protein
LFCSTTGGAKLGSVDAGGRTFFCGTGSGIAVRFATGIDRLITFTDGDAAAIASTELSGT